MAELRTLKLHRQQLQPAKNGWIAWLTLNRPDKANAFNAEMLSELRQSFESLGAETACRALVIKGEGKHFSAGADLSWMKASAGLPEEENFQEANFMAGMFAALYRLPFPVLALIRGAAYGGGTGLAACCDLVLADESARFCLSEVRLGILPAVILPYLSVKMRPASLIRYSMTSRLFSAQEACEAGLVTLSCPAETMQDVLKEELDGLLRAGPRALERLKLLQQSIFSWQAGAYSLASRAIAEARSGEEAQLGFSAFFGKVPPPWESCWEPLPGEPG